MSSRAAASRELAAPPSGAPRGICPAWAASASRASPTQAAGFLKIPGGENPLDRTWIHPESYAVATRLLEKLGFSPG